ncbi:hypothetical protein [Streptomyces microflavus]|uniref:hypothetical protein n=1 Tax=Streptomyces microflavus TaxID=1919 RepID=UPI0033AA1D32
MTQRQPTAPERADNRTSRTPTGCPEAAVLHHRDHQAPYAATLTGTSAYDVAYGLRVRAAHRTGTSAAERGLAPPPPVREYHPDRTPARTRTTAPGRCRGVLADPYEGACTMTTPASAQPLGEPFSEALSEAAQAAAMSVRLILTIADAVRRAAQRHHDGKEKELPDGYGKHAEDRWAAVELGKHLPADLLDHLAGSPDWPVMARQLMSLAHAGVDLTHVPSEPGHHGRRGRAGRRAERCPYVGGRHRPLGRPPARDHPRGPGL